MFRSLVTILVLAFIAAGCVTVNILDKPKPPNDLSQVYVKGDKR
jgi:hypothetical protein